MKNLNDVYFENKKPYFNYKRGERNDFFSWENSVLRIKQDLEEYGNIIKIVDEVYRGQKGIHKRYYVREKPPNYPPPIFPSKDYYKEHSFVLDSRRVGLVEDGLPFEREFEVVILDE